MMRKPPAAVIAIRLPLRLMNRPTTLNGTNAGWSCQWLSVSGKADGSASTTADASISSGSSPQIERSRSKGSPRGPPLPYEALVSHGRGLGIAASRQSSSLSPPGPLEPPWSSVGEGVAVELVGLDVCVGDLVGSGVLVGRSVGVGDGV